MLKGRKQEMCSHSGKILPGEGLVRTAQELKQFPAQLRVTESFSD
jgi:hypothetical protein